VTTIVTLRHLRELGYCSRGARAFAARHGLDWPAFLRQGVPAAQLEATGDAMAQAAVDRARRTEADRG